MKTIVPTVKLKGSQEILCEITRDTHNAVLHAKAQLVPQIWPPDENSGNGWASDNVQLYPSLIL